MAKVPPIVPITDLRQDAAAVLKQLRDQKQPLVITQRGRAAAVMLSIEEYERSVREHDLLKLLAQGEKEIQVEKGHTLAEVLKEADALLAEDS
ncbi:MAG: type II toxin-antitoxin system Phd/YefM family antitoxin [Candidatus Eisenbacteria bacterium]|uniref:Antitoxin n=1 Tax=Eiseniibacteriota bacterium TaxID=2212470 RepID=A0A7Y2E8U2_UNCEI|nr:type II toxin-antitoxin system Phd/YefM family antitoxin [Candidatus Eisenbacteria bacterium]